MDIDCPDCGGRVELNQNNIIPYHDNGSPIVCAGSGRQVSAASTQLHCTWCEAPAVCITTSEGDPYQLVCDEHCGHGDEEGPHAFLSEPPGLLAIINRLQARVCELEEQDEQTRADAAAAEREACAAIAERVTEGRSAPGGFVRMFGDDIAAAIRARGAQRE